MILVASISIMNKDDMEATYDTIPYLVYLRELERKAVLALFIVARLRTW